MAPGALMLSLVVYKPTQAAAGSTWGDDWDVLSYRKLQVSTYNKDAAHGWDWFQSSVQYLSLGPAKYVINGQVDGQAYREFYTAKDWKQGFWHYADAKPNDDEPDDTYRECHEMGGSIIPIVNFNIACQYAFFNDKNYTGIHSGFGIHTKSETNLDFVSSGAYGFIIYRFLGTGFVGSGVSFPIKWRVCGNLGSTDPTDPTCQ